MKDNDDYEHFAVSILGIHFLMDMASYQMAIIYWRFGGVKYLRRRFTGQLLCIWQKTWKFKQYIFPAKRPYLECRRGMILKQVFIDTAGFWDSTLCSLVYILAMLKGNVLAAAPGEWIECVRPQCSDSRSVNLLARLVCPGDEGREIPLKYRPLLPNCTAIRH